MGELATNRNPVHYYRGRTYFYLSSDEGRLDFYKSYEGDWFFTQTSSRRPEGAVKYFQKTGHISQRQSRGHLTHGWSANTTSYQAHRDQVSPLLDFCRKWWFRNSTYWYQGTYFGYLTKPLDTKLFGCLLYKINGQKIKVILICEGVWYYTYKADILEDLSQKG